MTNRFIKYKTLIFLATVLALGIISCRSYKDLAEAPAPDSKGLVRNMPENISDTTSIADMPWKEYFTDPKLQQLIEEGLNNNLNFKIAISRIKQAEATLMMEGAANQPTVSAGWQLTHTRTSSGKRGTDVLGYSTSVNQLGFSASWEVDLWGKLNNQAKAKYAALLNSNENKNLVQTSLIANIAKAYYTLLAYDEQLTITRENIASLQKSAETMQSLMTAGQQNAAAVEQSKALLYNTQLSVPTLETQIRVQEDALCALLGRKPGPIARSAMADQSVSSRLSYGVPAKMLAKRPDVKQAELSLRAAYATVDVAKANFYPSLTISSASLGFAGGFTDFFKPANIAASIVGGLTQPLLNKKQLKGNLKIAQAQQEEALLTFQNTILTAGQEVSDILFGYHSSLSKNENRGKQITSLTKSVDYTQELLKAGEANYTEVLSAQRDLLSAQLNQVNDKLEQLTYGVSLYKALGGGVR
ncbi:MAG: efflux system, outer rane lipoprotein, NodT family [Bacteroidetes bacterium]|nr:efflux system, outer rane lipoprotein, NodT family [Bacteroidota bacterium]